MQPAPGSPAPEPTWLRNISDVGSELELLRALERSIRENRAATHRLRDASLTDKLAAVRAGARRCEEILALLDLLRAPPRPVVVVQDG